MILVSAAGRFLWLAVTAPTEGEQADKMQKLWGQIQLPAAQEPPDIQFAFCV